MYACCLTSGWKLMVNDIHFCGSSSSTRKLCISCSFLVYFLVCAACTLLKSSQSKLYFKMLCSCLPPTGMKPILDELSSIFRLVCIWIKVIFSSDYFPQTSISILEMWYLTGWFCLLHFRNMRNVTSWYKVSQQAFLKRRPTMRSTTACPRIRKPTMIFHRACWSRHCRIRRLQIRWFV